MNQKASFRLRFSAYFIDNVIISIVYTYIFLLLNILINVDGTALLFAYSVTFLFYYLLGFLIFNRSLGKAVHGLYVVSPGSSKYYISNIKYLLREIAKPIIYAIPIIGFILALASIYSVLISKRRTTHDSLFKTNVIKVNKGWSVLVQILLAIFIILSFVGALPLYSSYVNSVEIRKNNEAKKLISDTVSKLEAEESKLTEFYNERDNWTISYYPDLYDEPYPSGPIKGRKPGDNKYVTFINSLGSRESVCINSFSIDLYKGLTVEEQNANKNRHIEKSHKNVSINGLEGFYTESSTTGNKYNIPNVFTYTLFGKGRTAIIRYIFTDVNNNNSTLDSCRIEERLVESMIATFKLN